MCNVEEISTVQTLFEVAKSQNMVDTKLGKNVRIRISKVFLSQGRRRRGQVVEKVSSYTLDANKNHARMHAHLLRGQHGV